MFRRIAFGAGIALLALLALSSAAVAKTALTSSSIPEEPVAGEPFQVGFTLENHDGLVLDDVTFKVTATSVASGETLAFEALPNSDSWSATVTLPDSGTWLLKVVNEDLGFQQDMAGVFVAEPASAVVSPDQLNTAIAEARVGIAADLDAQYATRFAALETELTTLQKSMADIGVERDALQAENASLQASLDAQSSGLSVWQAALIGAVVAAATLAAGFALALRRGILRRERPAVAVRA
jgi:hypothetical protein